MLKKTLTFKPEKFLTKAAKNLNECVHKASQGQEGD
jgi:hypothetical protein